MEIHGNQPKYCNPIGWNQVAAITATQDKGCNVLNITKNRYYFHLIHTVKLLIPQEVYAVKHYTKNAIYPII